MRILIDALSARGGGGYIYILHILPALLRIKSAHEFHILLSRRYQNALIKVVPDGIFVIDLDLPDTPLWRRWWFVQKKIPRILKEGKFSLLFTTTEIGAIKVSVPHVVLVRNLNIYAPYFIYSRWDQRLKLLGYQAARQPLAYLTLRSADRIVFVSEAFRNQVVTQFRLPMEKTRVVYHGINPVFINSAADKEPFLLKSKNIAKRSYLLTVSTIYPHKNYETLLDAFALLAREKPSLGLQLVIAGEAKDQDLFLSLQRRTRDLNISDRVHFLGFVEYEKLPELYRNAFAFVFPSRLESFGHPLVEAMASGTPIIASDLPVFHEICQNAALYFPVNDATKLAEQVITLIENPEVREQLGRLGLKRAKNFSWERTAVQMVKIFEELV
ncbi:glycosyltransferase family 4 protein [Candidatus Bipolaricaulota sp. J31]